MVIKMMKILLNKKLMVFIIIAVFMLSIFTAMSGLFAIYKVGGRGRVKGVGVGVYTDSTYTINLTQISWGNLSRGETITYYMYVKNIGTEPISLNMSTQLMPTWLSLSWNSEGIVLIKNDRIMPTLTLNVAMDAPFEEFNFDIIITGTETQ